MALNYPSLQALALRLIDENGRDCVISKKGRVANDSTKPWRGPLVTPHDPLQPTDPQSQTIKCVIVPSEYEDEKGNNIRRANKATMYVAHTAFEEGGPDPKTFDVVDDTVTAWKICDMKPIMPGELIIVYIAELEG